MVAACARERRCSADDAPELRQAGASLGRVERTWLELPPEAFELMYPQWRASCMSVEGTSCVRAYGRC